MPSSPRRVTPGEQLTRDSRADGWPGRPGRPSARGARPAARSAMWTTVGPAPRAARRPAHAPALPRAPGRQPRRVHPGPRPRSTLFVDRSGLPHLPQDVGSTGPPVGPVPAGAGLSGAPASLRVVDERRQVLHDLPEQVPAARVEHTVPAGPAVVPGRDLDALLDGRQPEDAVQRSEVGRSPARRAPPGSSPRAGARRPPAPPAETDCPASATHPGRPWPDPFAPSSNQSPSSQRRPATARTSLDGSNGASMSCVDRRASDARLFAARPTTNNVAEVPRAAGPSASSRSRRSSRPRAPGVTPGSACLPSPGPRDGGTRAGLPPRQVRGTRATRTRASRQRADSARRPIRVRAGRPDEPGAPRAPPAPRRPAGRAAVRRSPSPVSSGRPATTAAAARCPGHDERRARPRCTAHRRPGWPRRS